MRLGQLVGGETPVVVALEGLQADGAEELLGRGEARQQPLEVLRALDATADFVREHRLGGARRADHQQVLAGEQPDQRAVDEDVAFQELLPQLVPNGAQQIPRRRHAARIRLACRRSQPRGFAWLPRWWGKLPRCLASEPLDGPFAARTYFS